MMKGHSITNPVTLLLLAERVISDIACGVVDYNPVEFKKKFIHMVDSLYDSGQMQSEEISIFDIDGDRFKNCRGLYEHVLRRNRDYYLGEQKSKLTDFWRNIFENPESTDLLLRKFHPQMVFSEAVELEQIINALESLNNSRLYQLVEWLDVGFEKTPGDFKASIDPALLEMLHTSIRSNYADQAGVRASHLRRIAEILSSQDSG